MEQDPGNETLTETIATYDFSEDALGFGDFILSNMTALPNEEVVVYVFDDEGRCADVAAFEREVLSDGSKVVNLIIKFDRQSGVKPEKEGD